MIVSGIDDCQHVIGQHITFDTTVTCQLVKPASKRFVWDIDTLVPEQFDDCNRKRGVACLVLSLHRQRQPYLTL